ncbi:hypothetical protein L873DRAFT_1816123 [Choiromyces venosus 120613-1]|uniref:Uncharacterized protein n=1 Tax=Choiromyces venosus 120613-1 TaxID=1336337 RepID=A0A3N4J597_9PEZI|nr:hypothetical protein L873DRAFT_1816123 [Choiromyces venosus 120613-1]
MQHADNLNQTEPIRPHHKLPGLWAYHNITITLERESGGMKKVFTWLCLNLIFSNVLYSGMHDTSRVFDR